MAELDRTTRELVESRARILEADVVARRELEEAISREVLPRLVALPDQLRAARLAVQGGATNGLDALVADTNSALEELRELTRGVFPTQLDQGRHRAHRSVVPRPDRPGAHAAGRRLGGVAEVPGAGGDRGLLLLRRGDPPRPVDDGDSRSSAADLVLRDRGARAIDGGPAAGPGPGRGGRGVALPDRAACWSCGYRWVRRRRTRPPTAGPGPAAPWRRTPRHRTRPRRTDPLRRSRAGTPPARQRRP